MPHRLAAILVLSAPFVAGVNPPARAQGTTTRVSVDSSGIEGNDGSWSASMSADGQIVAFCSDASNLVAGDTNGKADVFVHDLSTGITERVSVDSSGVEADRGSTSVAISADGRFVAFSSRATNLVAGDKNGTGDVFVHDRGTGITERVSMDSSGAESDGDSSGSVAISADGIVVAFHSVATSLVAKDTNGWSDVFVHDRSTGTTERVSVDSSGAEANGGSLAATISKDGAIVVFGSSASNLVAKDTNGVPDVFVHDRSTGVTERVSVDSSGAELKFDSYAPSISADGQIVAYYGGDPLNAYEVFTHDRTSGITECVSVDSSGARGDNSSYVPLISADGQSVVFHSFATNLVANDTNGWYDVFLHDRSNGSTERISVDSSGAQANNGSLAGAVSADGQGVIFFSYASNLVPGDANGVSDAFVHARCLTSASWSNYGSGYAGTNGVPSFTARSNPVLGTTLTLDLANSCGGQTVALWFIGLQQTQIHTPWGGDLLVAPLLSVPLTLPPSGTILTGDLSSDAALCGLEVDLQAVESDSGAAEGISFTPGLQLILGR